MKPSTIKLMKLIETPTFEKMFQFMSENGNRIASEYLKNNKEVQVTYEEFTCTCKKMAHNLQILLKDYNEGSYIGLHLDNSPDWPCLLWGILMSGFNPILLDFRASRENLHHLLNQSGTVAIITDEKAHIKEGVKQLSKEDVTEMKSILPDNWKPLWSKYMALCTSGTTSTSKVFVYDEKSLMMNVGYGYEATEASDYLVGEKVKMLAFLPCYHIFGLFCINFWPHVFGDTIVYLKDRSPLTFIETCQRFNVTQIQAVPLVWNNLIAKLNNKIAQEYWYKRLIFHSLCKLSFQIQHIFPRIGRYIAKNILFRGIHKKLLGSKMRTTVSAGAYLSPTTLKLMTSIGYVVISGYGMTESGIVSIDPGMVFKKRIHSSIGRPFSCVKAKIVDKNGNISDSGELYLKGHSLHSGRLIDGKMVEADSTNGWLETGDLGTIDKDGYIYLQGRSKDTIIKETGENVYPDELEDHFRKISNLNEFSIMGLKNTNNDEDIVMVINIDEISNSSELTEELRYRIAKKNLKLPIYKRLGKVYISRKKLPITTSMKTQRQKLKRLIEAGEWQLEEIDIKNIKWKKQKTGKNSQKQNNQIKEKVREIFAQVLCIPKDDIADDAHFLNQLGGDSLQAIELASTLETEFKVFISDSVLLECTNVLEITEAIIRQKNNTIQSTDKLKVVRSKTNKKTIACFEDSREYKQFRYIVEQVGDFDPYFVKHDSIVKDTSMVENKEVINLGSYNYLGFSGHPEVLKAAQEAVQNYGTSASGSRLLTGEKSLYIKLEEELAKWKHSEASLILVSGHATNVTFVGNFCTENDLIVYDALSHNSIEQGCRLSKSDSKAFPHNDFVALENILQQTREYYEKILIIVEGVYSMDGDIAPIPKFVELKKKYNTFLMVDEAHSTGVIGETGRGVDEYFHLDPNDIDIRMGTLSKGLGSCGGYLAGKKTLINYLKYNLPGFVFSVGIPPASAGAALKAIELAQTDFSMIKNLQQNITFFVEESKKRNFHTCLAKETAIIPILIGDEQAAFVLSKHLREGGVCVPPAVYPAVQKGKARLRFCVTSDHKKEQLTYALDLLKETAEKLEIELPGIESKLASA